ncbi:hypothetical protein K8R47_03120 [archaeon]|nr:hypothetical protein [archaeon]
MKSDNSKKIRDDNFLQERLSQIWELLYPDTLKLNNVNIIFKGKSQYKFGHIAKKGRNTEIVINSLFKFPQIPEYIIDLTIAHELAHYAHGFNSPLPQKFKHPHKGGVVTKELLNRGFKQMEKKEKLFLKKEWPKLYNLLKDYRN